MDGCCEGKNVGLVTVRVSWRVVGVVKRLDVMGDYYCNAEGLYVIGRLPVLFIIFPVDNFKPMTSFAKAFYIAKLTCKVFSAPTPCRHPTKFKLGTIT